MIEPAKFIVDAQLLKLLSSLLLFFQQIVNQIGHLNVTFLLNITKFTYLFCSTKIRFQLIYLYLPEEA